ncbi:aBC transporter substrate-binding protein [Clostridium sp. CAG:557]|nr:aBC transporter substrate-binding protein [Clostridium sp. CAG:557]
MTCLFKKFLNFMTVALVGPFFILNLPGCTSSKSETSKSEKITVIATLFPQYDFAKQIAGDKAEVSLLLPPGTESHTYDPTPADILKVSNSDIFLYTGKEMEPWADKIINSVKNKNLIVGNVSTEIDLMKLEHHHHDDEQDHEKASHHEHNFDPHIWLDPTLAAKMVDNITLIFCQKDPQNSDYYKGNAEIYKNKLHELDENFKNMINSSKRKSIVFAGRFAHLYFINHYGLEYIAAFDGCSTEAEPSVKKISKIIDFIYKNNIPAIYYEEISEPKVANSIAEQTGTKTLKFSTLHNVTKEQLESNITYIDLMQENLENLRQGLN